MSRRDAFHLLPHTKSPTNSALPHSDYPVFAEAFMYHYHCCKAHQIFAVFFTFPATVQCSVVVTRVGAMRWRVRGGCGKMCILINLKIYYKSAPLSSHIISRSRPWMTVANKEGRMGWRMLKWNYFSLCTLCSDRKPTHTCPKGRGLSCWVVLDPIRLLPSASVIMCNVIDDGWFN